MHPPMLEVRQLVKRYGPFEAVGGITFSIQPGEILGFLGSNGAGKTTTMKMIAGLLQPSSGSVFVDGIDIQRDPIAAKQIIGYIPDRPFIYEKLTALEFLYFVAGLYNCKQDAIEGRALALLERFGLSHVHHELIENYSHGMKQRLTMASALIHEPRLIIVDEPMVGLDPRGSLLIRKIFRELCEEKNVAIFLSTHTLSIAQEVCHRIGILTKGSLIALGTLQELQKIAETGAMHLEDIFLRITEAN